MSNITLLTPWVSENRKTCKKTVKVGRISETKWRPSLLQRHQFITNPYTYYQYDLPSDFSQSFMNEKHIAAIIAIIGIATMLFNHQNAPAVSEFDHWKIQHGITFSSEIENAYRENIFLKNLAQINQHNSNDYRTYDMGLNQFSAMTEEEFSQTYLRTIFSQEAENNNHFDDISVGDIDWVAAGAVTPVKNQGPCGSQWAFSITGALEGLSKVGHNKLQSFSEQQLLDCSSSYGNQGCFGGFIQVTLKYVKDKGIVHEEDYPYQAAQQTCKQTTGYFRISGYIVIKDTNQCTALASALVGRPISVAVDASNWSPYKSGIFSNCKTEINHAVLLVGVTDNYWWVKNSWGTSWGENGFIRLARGNTCGICMYPSYPTK